MAKTEIYFIQIDLEVSEVYCKGVFFAYAMVGIICH